FDRSFDIAYQVLTPERNGIALAVGLRDFMGTGIYAGEYIVATTSLGDNLKLSGGVGWGRLSDSNTVHTDFARNGGVPNAGSWFRGPVGFFGGLEWQTPIDRLTFKAEYSSDRYIPETGAQRNSPALFDRNSQFNFGLDYKLWQNSSLGFYYMYGSELGLKFSTNINPKRPIKRATFDPAPQAIRRRENNTFDTNWVNQASVNADLRSNLDTRLAPEGIRVEGLAINGTVAELRIKNNRYNIPAQAIGRTARVMANTLPASVETFVITPMEQGLAAVSVKLNRSTLEDSEFHLNGSEEILANAEILAADPRPIDMQYSEKFYPNFSWSLAPYLEFTYFDPAEPVRGELGLRLRGKVQLRPGLSFSSALTKRIVGNNGKGTIS
ncbi:MAG: YjbH domain-containing protein, partial [Amylibacter sp.]